MLTPNADFVTWGAASATPPEGAALEMFAEPPDTGRFVRDLLRRYDGGEDLGDALAEMDPDGAPIRGNAGTLDGWEGSLPAYDLIVTGGEIVEVHTSRRHSFPAGAPALPPWDYLGAVDDLRDRDPLPELAPPPGPGTVTPEDGASIFNLWGLLSPRPVGAVDVVIDRPPPKYEALDSPAKRRDVIETRQAEIKEAEENLSQLERLIALGETLTDPATYRKIAIIAGAVFVLWFARPIVAALVKK